MNSLFCFAAVVSGVVFCQTCVDLKIPATGISECAARSNLCNNSAYYQLMTTQCPRTCGRCGSVTTTTTVTTPTSDDLKNPRTCTQRASLCNNPA